MEVPIVQYSYDVEKTPAPAPEEEWDVTGRVTLSKATSVNVKPSRVPAAGGAWKVGLPKYDRCVLCVCVCVCVCV